jgi:putative endonuclease
MKIKASGNWGFFIAKKMSFWVYIIFSEKYDRFYIGQTNDLDGRIERHNSGYVESTKSFRPWVLKLALSKDNRSESMVLEKKLKNLNRLRLIEFIEKYR